MQAANPSAVLYNPVAPAGGANTVTFNLTVNQTVGADTDPIKTLWLTATGNAVTGDHQTFFPALYYVYQNTPGCNKSTLNCFKRYEIKSGTAFPPKAAARTDCSGSSCTVAQELQNFANWFQYYRSRILMARAGSGQAFSDQGADMRVGFGTINTPNTIVRRVSNDFSQAEKTDFLNILYSQRMPKAGTPLRQAVDQVGQYFMDTSSNGPWQNLAMDATSGQLSCRQNYNILMTDGYWNGEGAGNGRTSNFDGVDGPVMSGAAGQSYQYHARSPYSDNEDNTLADIAFFYWSRDLRPDWGAARKNVPVTGSDPAFWQHLVQFTVGLGVNGTLDPVNDLPALTAGTKSWPAAASHQVDDLWHAAVNSRGQYFSAGDPLQFTNALRSALGSIADRVGNAAAVGSSGYAMQAGSSLYISTYKSSDWSGTLQQKVLDVNGNITSNGWTASLPPTGRKVFTYADASSKGVVFSYANLSASDKAYFDAATASYPGVSAANIVDYIAGGSDLGKLRHRSSPFGDFVNSAPQYLKEGIDEGYTFLPAGTPGRDGANGYNKYLLTKVSRPAMVYVGGNDGMLHAFNAFNGIEQFAYVPKSVMSNLPLLTSPAYTHRYFVDATPNFGDAFLGGSWKTILLGATGAGGRGVFALDITNPSSFAANNILWEVNSATDGDIGSTIGTPQIGRMPDGKWVAVFGNGYESDAYHAVLMIADLATGAITKIDTGIGSILSKNGLATPRLLIGPDATIKAVYVGDLQGNLWKFDFSSNSAGVAFNGVPLFKARYGTQTQAVTVQPEIVRHKNGGYMVLFGTGKIFEDSDAISGDIQSMYGIWDNSDIPDIKPTAITNSQSGLQQQVLSATTTASGAFYSVTDNTVDWSSKRGWFINLNLQTGERITVNPQLFFDQIVMTSVIPGSSVDPCASDGRSVTYAIRALTGGPVPYRVFDTNGDGVVNTGDAQYNGRQSSLTFGTTIIQTKNGPKFIQPNANDNSGSKGADRGTSASPAGQPIPSTLRLWRQILGKD